MFKWIAIAASIISGVCASTKIINAEPYSVLAVPCDHRFGAQASWSQETDTAAVNSFYYAEACAFKFNLALTVFDNPFFQKSGHIPLPQRREANETGRIGFQVYFSSDRWQNPKVPENEPNPAKKFPVIPDYYSDKWTKAGVAAGFKVQVGRQKPKRFPNHGQQLYDISDGKYGFDVDHNQPGETDVLTGLINYQRSWNLELYGEMPSAGAYRNGQTASSYAMPKFFLGLRNSDATGDVCYGKSTEREGFLGNNCNDVIIPPRMCLKPGATRAGDMDASRDEVLRHCGDLLRQAIAANGWYNDFIHWHTNPRYHTTLHDFYQSQREIMAGHDVVTLDYGSAVEYKTLRDMATIKSECLNNGIQIQVTYRDPYGMLPLETIDIPLSIKVDLSQSPLRGKDISSPESLGIRKLGNDLFVVEVPFHQCEETFNVNLYATNSPNYLDFSLPTVKQATLVKGILTVQTQPAARLAIFINFDEKDPKKVKLLKRSNQLNALHKIDLSPYNEQIKKHPVHIGVITQERRSILFGPITITPPAHDS
ncbi:MAG: hypothetical protein JW709_02490 [Sedimentisphaerales bacterium]|nr:hypothetical protein [Sedimentisphaerales bacterium]